MNVTSMCVCVCVWCVCTAICPAYTAVSTLRASVIPSDGGRYAYVFVCLGQFHLHVCGVYVWCCVCVEVATEWTEDSVKTCVVVYLALLPLNPKLLKE